MDIDSARIVRRDRSLAWLIEAQHGIIARRQLTPLGLDWDHVAHQVWARRWAVRTPRVISTFTGSPTVQQRRWVGVLHAGPRSMLGGLTAASRHGLVGWERDVVTVLVDDELSFEAVPGVRFFRSRRPFHLMQSPRPGIPSATLEHSLLLWAGYDAELRAGVGVLAAAVQQRLTTATRLRETIEHLHPLRRAKLFTSALAAIDGGAHSGAEVEVARMCRLFAMPLPHRQTSRIDADGRRRWTDCEWRLADGSVVVLEVDGSHHVEVRQWQADIRRSRRLVARDRVMVRCTAFELRHEPAEVAVDLVALGVPGRVPHTAA